MYSMTIKLVLLKSGEDIIADVAEMASGEGEDKRVVGYFLHKPCIVKLRDSQVLTEEVEAEQKSSFKVSLFPWMPLTSDKTIPVPADWLVTMVEPKEKLKQMYIEDVLTYGQDNQSSGSDEQSDSNQSD
jgi:hypothetical protein